MRIQTLRKENLQQILELQQLVVANLVDTELFYQDTPDYIEDLLVTKGVILGAFDDNNLVGYRGIKFCLNAKENLGKEIDIVESELDLVAHFDALVVHPNYRRQGIAHRLNIEALDLIKQRNKKHLFVKVSPKNTASLAMLAKLGMEIKKKIYPYEKNWERYLLYKNLEIP
ncbi:GNAT family N-acetyltransferase [Floridanema aerugineum]|uniref:GNAT family N-acetyltransferase n=1 Tax=Floridaenema aerugineum BLCC-F46 TaxID=3153654 RepID=A0ABV4X008_9CYAN